MQTAQTKVLPLFILLFVAASRSAFGQFDEFGSSTARSAPDASHRLLPADAQTLLRLRERTELLRALGLSPQNSTSQRTGNRPQSTSRPESMSPQLLELLRQMTPQTLPERSSNQRDSSQLRRQNRTRSTAGLPGNATEDSQRLQKLNELLKQNDLSPSDLRQLQELMQPSGTDSEKRGSTRGVSSASSTSGGPARQSRAGEPTRQTRNPPANGGLEALIGNGNSASRSGDDGSTNSNTDRRNAADAHAERQEMLRRAFGIDPKSPSSVSGRAGSNASPNQNRGFSLDSMREEINRNRLSDPDSLLNKLNDNSVSARNAGPGNSGNDSSDPRQQASHPSDDIGQRRDSAATSPHSNANGLSEQRNGSGSDVTGDERSKRLSEIAKSEQPAWQKLQRIAQLARRETNQRSAASLKQTDGSSDSGFGLSNGLTRKLADVVQSAAEATAETVSELRNGVETQERSQSRAANSRTEPRSEIRDWASSVNDWIASLPEEDAEISEPTSSAIEGDTEVESFRPVTWLIGLLIGGSIWWLLRHRFGTEVPEEGSFRKRPRLAANASERERLIHAFHELVHQSRCGSEEWWHHTRAVRQLTRQKPQLASAIQSLATIYEQARYSPDSEPSAEQLAAARSALKQCGKR